MTWIQLVGLLDVLGLLCNHASALGSKMNTPNGWTTTWLTAALAAPSIVSSLGGPRLQVGTAPTPIVWFWYEN
jgi:hypothetical protein